MCFSLLLVCNMFCDAIYLAEIVQCKLSTGGGVCDAFEQGVSLSGCVYERFGRECSLSTGDLLKIIDFTITRFTARTSSNAEIEIPVEYPGNRPLHLI